MGAETFILPEKDGTFIVYNPFKKIVAKVNKSFVDELSKRMNKDQKPVQCPDTKFDPKSVILILTNDCNLRCKYCYSSYGESSEKMSWEIAKAAVDYVANKESMNVSFFGGEPTLAFDIMKKVVNYVRKINPKVIKFNMQSNGLFSKEILDFIKENKIRTRISFDGTPDLQRKQRPAKSGDATDIIINNIKELVHSKLVDIMRVTVTQDSVDRLSDMVKFAHSLCMSGVHLEPCTIVGRALNTGIREPDKNKFVKEFIKAFELAEKLNLYVHISGILSLGYRYNFCGACGKNFIITPTGLVTSCLEVSSFKDTAPDLFIYGHYNHLSKSFEFNKDILSNQTSRKVINIPECKKCFLKWNCAGGCLARTYRATGSLYKVEKDLCYIKKEISKYLLRRMAAGERIRMIGFKSERIQM